MAVIHAITLFSIYYLFQAFFIARRYGYVYIYLLTQVVLRSNHKKKGLKKTSGLSVISCLTENPEFTRG